MAVAARTGVLVCLGLVLAMFSLDSAITAHKMRTRGTDSQLRGLKERGYAFRARRRPDDLRSPPTTKTKTNTTWTSSHNGMGEPRSPPTSTREEGSATRPTDVDMARENIFVKLENKYPSDERDRRDASVRVAGRGG